jgi:hypothetical protein
VQTAASRAMLVGYFSAYVQCGPQAAAGAATFAAQTGRFNSGKAVVSASGSASDNISSASASAQRTVQLRGKN